jgi:hypothetical protein
MDDSRMTGRPEERMERLVTWGIAIVILLVAVAGLASLASVRHGSAARHEAPAGRSGASSPPTIDLQAGRPATAAGESHRPPRDDPAPRRTVAQ